MKPQMAPQAIMATGFTWAVPPLSAAAVEFPAAAGIAESDAVSASPERRRRGSSYAAGYERVIPRGDSLSPIKSCRAVCVRACVCESACACACVRACVCETEWADIIIRHHMVRNGQLTPRGTFNAAQYHTKLLIDSLRRRQSPLRPPRFIRISGRYPSPLSGITSSRMLLGGHGTPGVGWV